MGKRPLPPLAVLQAFCAIAETGGFGRAAERMGLTRTAVSHQLSTAPEGWIGGKLFDRGRSGARLTPLGARLRPSDCRDNLSIGDSAVSGAGERVGSHPDAVGDAGIFEPMAGFARPRTFANATPTSS